MYSEVSMIMPILRPSFVAVGTVNREIGHGQGKIFVDLLKRQDDSVIPSG